MLKKIISLSLILGAVVLFNPPPALAATIIGKDFQGGDLTPGAGDVLYGTFTNVRNFNIPRGATVYFAGAVSVSAANINVQGTLDGTGGGNPGGSGGIGGNMNPCANQDCANVYLGGSNGSNGTGPGGGMLGQGATHKRYDRSEEDGGCGCWLGDYLEGGGGPGGGGASYGASAGKGGAGDHNCSDLACGWPVHPEWLNFPGNPGAVYTNIAPGSGGGGGAGGQGGDFTFGGGGGGGGTGGGSIILTVSKTTIISGSIIANGTNGTRGFTGGEDRGRSGGEPGAGDYYGGAGGGGGGGGSGGSIVINSDTLDLSSGIIQAKGGNGGNGGDGGVRIGHSAWSAGGGGGGGGGMIKITYTNLIATGTLDVNGGAGGSGGYKKWCDSDNNCGSSTGSPGVNGATGTVYKKELLPINPNLTKPTVLPCTNASTYTIPLSWSPTLGITWVDLSTYADFRSYSHRNVVGTNSINVPFGFGLYQGADGQTQLFPNTTYFTRLYNGTNHSQITSFTRPRCS
jgi:hypothetical protein